MTSYENYGLPVEYTSLMYLHTKLGDITIVECACTIWNKLNIGNTLRVLNADDMLSVITLTGICSDSEAAIKVCKWLVSIMIDVRYQKTIISMEI